MKDVTNNATNNFLETIEPVYTPGTIKFDFEKFDAAVERKQQAEAKAKAEAARLAEIEAMAQQSANE